MLTNLPAAVRSTRAILHLKVKLVGGVSYMCNQKCPRVAHADTIQAFFFVTNRLTNNELPSRNTL